MSLLNLFLTFAKFGVYCFGGGYMLVPLIVADLVGKPPKPLTPEMFSNLMSIAQMTPGPIGINTATYVGFLSKGVIGGIVAGIGLVSISFVLVMIAINLLKRYEKSVWVRGFLRGMKAGTCGFIFSAVAIFLGYSVLSKPIPWLHPSRLWSGEIRFYPGALLIALAVWLTLRYTKLPFTLVLILAGAAGAFLAV